MTALANKQERTAVRLRQEENQCLEIMRRVANKAAKVVNGLFEHERHPDYNEDAKKPWAEASTKTRAALAIVKDERILAGAQAGTVRAFGVIVLPGRMQSVEEWEQQAAKAIDVEVVGK